jgi:hydrogenase expression/formation protein HypC
MCLAIPMVLTERTELEGVVELDGVRRTVSLMLLPDAEVGDHLLIHAGFAIGSVDADEAAKTLEILREFADNMEAL